jgi:aldehyde:ferredoxin oxidoreductase
MAYNELPDMKEIIGATNRVLEINLTSRATKEFTVDPADLQLYLGGKGLALKYLYERLKPGIDPLGSDNILILTMGAYLGTGTSCSGRFNAVTKSPLTGIIVSSSCGGPFGMAFKTAGYDGLIISGKSENPVCLVIDHESIRFEDAAALWGNTTRQTQQMLNMGAADGALVIGPAGENLVRFANVCSGHRFLGRGGIGAVMGSKNLKAILARGGTYKIVPKLPGLFQKVKKQGMKYINDNDFTGNAYRNFGTCANVLLSDKAGILPVRNFQDGSHPRAHEISGQAWKEQYSQKPSTCKPCSIICGHKGTFEKGKVMQFPEYETTGVMGSNLEIFNPQAISEWNELAGDLGIDTISLGTTLSYAIEATEKGLIKSNLAFGSPEGIIELINDIAYRRGLGNDLANGTRWLAEKYGGMEFAIQVKGMEMAAYDPRGSWGQGLDYAVANRGACHLSAPIFALECYFNFLKPTTARHKHIYVHFLERMNAAINSMHVCQFTSFAYMLEPFVAKYTPKPLLAATMQMFPRLALALLDVRVYSRTYYAITGIRMSQSKMLEAGERVHALERLMNTREGISRKDDSLPKRFLTEGRKSDPDKKLVPLGEMLDAYYRIKGFDKNGIPKHKTLKKLKILTKF